MLIADDHALFRRGLEMVLEEEDDIDLVGQASDGTEAVTVAGESLPDVVLMDIRMPKSSGIEACRATKEVAPSAKIVMLTISDEEEDLFEAIRAGASGYLLKDIPLDEVAEAVRAVHGGQSLINPSMAGKLLTEFATLAKRDSEEEQAQHVAPPKLTDREMEVLKLVARGMNNRDIAKELFISENTVKNHVRNILEKLQIHSRMEAVMIAVRQKLIEFSANLPRSPPGHHLPTPYTAPPSTAWPPSARALVAPSSQAWAGTVQARGRGSLELQLARARAAARRAACSAGSICSRRTSSQPTQLAASRRAWAIGSAAAARSSETLRATRVVPSRAGSTRPASRPPASRGIVK